MNDTQMASICVFSRHGSDNDIFDIPETIDEINALPNKLRKYIHDLETRMSTEGGRN